jgi:hypothetical protein
MGGRYGMGQKRCQICGLFIEWNDLKCPCCHYRLRIKPHNPKSKQRIILAIGDNIKKQKAKSKKTINFDHI